MLAALAVSVALANFDVPPKRFQGEVVVTLVTFAPDRIGSYCHEWGVDRADASGCYIAPLNAIAMINPCKASAPGYIGHLLCHEIGHAEGWPAEHPR